MQHNVGVFIGRMMPFHNGHAHIISQMTKEFGSIIILLGSSNQARDIKNPFTFDERKQLIEDWFYDTHPDFPTTNLFILPIEDYFYNEAGWIVEVQKAISSVCQDNSRIVLVGCNKDTSSYYLNVFGKMFTVSLFPAWEKDNVTLNATDIRKKLFEYGVQSTDSLLMPKQTIRFLKRFMLSDEKQDLRKEYDFISAYKQSWAAAPYAPTFVTADAIVIQSGHILVNQRGNYPGKGLWAFPGGYIDQNELVRDAAIRELQEETNIELAPAQIRGSIKAEQVFDYPGRSLRGRVITHAFLFRLNDQKPLPRVKPQAEEVLNLQWMPISTAFSNRNRWFEDHYEMLIWAVMNS